MTNPATDVKTTRMQEHSISFYTNCCSRYHISYADSLSLNIHCLLCNTQVAIPVIHRFCRRLLFNVVFSDCFPRLRISLCNCSTVASHRMYFVGPL